MSHATFTAPRFENGEVLGRFPVVIVRLIALDSYLVRFDDGHEAGAFVREIETQRCSA